MKKLIFGMSVLTIMFASSCSKSTNSNSNNYWTFKGTTYTTAACTQPVAGRISANNTTTSNVTTYGTLTASFSATPAAGTYTVVSTTPTTTSQVALTATINGATGASYGSTGGNGAETVTVTVASNGFVKISGSNLMMSSTTNAADSSALTLNITQTN